MQIKLQNYGQNATLKIDTAAETGAATKQMTTSASTPKWHSECQQSYQRFNRCSLDPFSHRQANPPRHQHGIIASTSTRSNLIHALPREDNAKAILSQPREAAVESEGEV